MICRIRQAICAIGEIEVDTMNGWTLRLEAEPVGQNSNPQDPGAAMADDVPAGSALRHFPARHVDRRCQLLCH